MSGSAATSTGFYDDAPTGAERRRRTIRNLFAELIRRGWSDEDLAKLAGGNVLRVMRQAEAVVGIDEGRAAGDGDARLDAADAWK